jgi:transketolase
MTNPLATALRFLSVDMVEKAASGHPGMPLGMADVLTVLFSEYLSFDASCPTWPNRDRFILSAGHGSAALYSLAYLLGYPGATLDDLKSFRQLGSKTPGHPEHDISFGIETTTGPLGQGLGNAVGMAIAQQMMAADLGEEIINHRTFVVAGDGCLMEGVGQEALSLAGHLGLNKLTVLFDDNHISIDGDTELSCSDNHIERFRACGWHTLAIDGHDPVAIRAALDQALLSHKPTFIACRTTIGWGAPTKAGTAATHGSPLGNKEIAQMRENLAWPHDPFFIPEEILTAWRTLGTRGKTRRLAWEKQAGALPENKKNRLNADFLQEAQAALLAYKKTLLAERPSMATRKASGLVLDHLAPLVPALVGGSADLTGSNNTRAKSQKTFTLATPEGRYIHYGIREHAMGAIMNGISLYGGLIPYGGTFLVFSDYLRPALRLSALMHQGVIYVLTHDSIGLGEDGPTHQPIEHLAALRAIPNVHVFRPADAVETLECWELALKNRTTPSVLALSRQDLPTLRNPTLDVSVNASARGAYLVSESVLPPQITLVATGSEVSLAVAVQTHLAAQNIGATVISMPCQELFWNQNETYRQTLFPKDRPVVAIEAASPLSWYRLVGDKGLIIGIETFGVSAPAADAYRHFGLTAEAVGGEIMSHYFPAAKSTA